MRIVSYNILNGGEGRADPLAEILIAQRADIVVLVEADDLAVLQRLAKRLDMDFIHATGNSSAAALLSRWPIFESINHAPLQPKISKSLLEAAIQEPDGPIWSMGIVHLHAHARQADEHKREEELQAVLGVFDSRRRSALPHLLLGDFNSNSPVQQIDPSACKPSTQKEWIENGGQIPRRVVQRLLDAGYIDSLHATNAQAAAAEGTFSTQHPGQRVDYIFCHGIPPARLHHAWIETNRLARYASDHFPVGLEILS